MHMAQGIFADMHDIIRKKVTGPIAKTKIFCDHHTNNEVQTKTKNLKIRTFYFICLKNSIKEGHHMLYRRNDALSLLPSMRLKLGRLLGNALLPRVFRSEVRNVRQRSL